MAKVGVSESLPVGVDAAWALASNLDRFGEWLTLHDGWRGELPAELAEGTELTSVVSVKGMRNRITWRITTFRPPERIELTGEGKGGTTVSLVLSVRPAGAGGGSTVRFDTEFANPALFGPIGSAVAATLKGDLRRSIRRFAALAE